MKKKKKLDFSQPTPLSHNPFAALSKLGALPQNPPSESTKGTEQVESAKNSLLIRDEKRKFGKWVTCIYHLEQDTDRHLRALKKQLGTGGTRMSDGHLELQGRRSDPVTAYFIRNGFKVLGRPG